MSLRRSVTLLIAVCAARFGIAQSACSSPPAMAVISWSGATCTSQNATQCSVGESLLFDASPTFGSFQSCDTFHWNFGDGTFADGRPITHAYVTPGQFTPSVTVSNPFGTQTSVSPSPVVLSEATVVPLIDAFTASQSRISLGAGVEVRWITRNTREVRIDPFGIPGKANDSKVVYPTHTMTITLVALGNSTPASRSLIIEVTEPPVHRRSVGRR